MSLLTQMILIEQHGLRVDLVETCHHRSVFHKLNSFSCDRYRDFVWAS